MKVKKIGHCCFVVDIDGVRIITDPGSFSKLQTEEINLDAILITHEHADHLHIDSLKKILNNNPKVIIITNTSVGEILKKEGISFVKVEDGEDYNLNGVKIVGFGNTHAEIYKDFGVVQNTGYMINELCYGGDAFTLPKQSVDILALPIVGPWMKIKDAIEFAEKIKPRICFPVHDALANKEFPVFLNVSSRILSFKEINFKVLEIGKEEEL